MSKVHILKKGTVGLAFNKRNSKLNGLVLDKIVVNDDEVDNPVLLNSFLFNKARAINYSIICENFCTIAHMDISTVVDSLKAIEADYEFWRQYYDSDQALDEEWTTKFCEECREYHTMFSCPKLAYMPLRSLIFIKSCFGRHEKVLL